MPVQCSAVRKLCTLISQAMKTIPRTQPHTHTRVPPSHTTRLFGSELIASERGEEVARIRRPLAKQAARRLRRRTERHAPTLALRNTAPTAREKVGRRGRSAAAAAVAAVFTPFRTAGAELKKVARRRRVELPAVASRVAAAAREAEEGRGVRLVRDRDGRRRGGPTSG